MGERRPTGARAMTLTSFTCLYHHLSLSPSIPTSSYLPIFYLTGFEEEREGMRERHRGLAPVGQGLISAVVDTAICIKCSHVITLTSLGKYHSVYLLLISDY